MVGLECYNANGDLILSVSDRITKVVGSVHISGNGSVSDESLNQGIKWFYPYNFALPASRGNYNFPTITANGNTISWSYSSSSRRVEMDLIYGVYQMTAGFQVVTQEGYLQVDENYSNLSLSKIVKLSSLPYNGNFEYYSLALEDNEKLIAIYTPNNEIVVEDLFYNSSANIHYFAIPQGNADDVSLFIFGEKNITTGFHGLQVFNEQGDCVFDSNFKQMTIAYFGTNTNTVTLDSSKKYAICTFGYNMSVVENTQPAGVAYSWFVPRIKNGVITVENIHTQNGHILTQWRPQTLWGQFNMFSYLVVDITNY